MTTYDKWRRPIWPRPNCVGAKITCILLNILTLVICFSENDNGHSCFVKNFRCYQDDEYDFETLDEEEKNSHAADFFYCIYDPAEIPADFTRSHACQQYIKSFYFFDSAELASYKTSGGKCIEENGDSYEMENELFEMLENLIYTSKFTPMNIEASMEVQSINEVMIHER